MFVANSRNRHKFTEPLVHRFRSETSPDILGKGGREGGREDKYEGGTRYTAASNFYLCDLEQRNRKFLTPTCTRVWQAEGDDDSYPKSLLPLPSSSLVFASRSRFARSSLRSSSISYRLEKVSRKSSLSYSLFFLPLDRRKLLFLILKMCRR